MKYEGSHCFYVPDIVLHDLYTRCKIIIDFFKLIDGLYVTSVALLEFRKVGVHIFVCFPML